MDDEAAVGGAVLAHVPEAGVDDVFGDAVEVDGVGEDDAWVFSAQFEGDFLEVALGGVFEDLSPDLGGSREGDGVDAVVGADGFAGY